ncbi:MAG: sugar ABC transporter permease [Stigonema ocellatum SAG 48.90 = DSM 106950]|nr:sugar ABC transporter permease [Stigonema ocellatum SAG 48.90 = DSM 106950]
MTNIEVMISLSAPDVESQELLQAQVENLLPQIREVDGVEEANLVTVAESPDGAKGEGFIVGTIKAVVIPGSMALFNFLKERLSGNPIEITLKKTPDSQEVKIKVRSQADFDTAYEKAQEFFKS